MMGGQYAWGPPATGCGSTSGGTPTDPLALGQRIFDTGVGAGGQPIVRTGGVGMMATSGCASCHGYDGRGRTTMMFAAPNVTYANLTDPAGMLDPNGTRGPTYTDDLIRRAVTQGLDAEGTALSTVMPRWQLTDEDWADLLRYMESLGGSSGATP
jgi:mono/diheme cytochrome c family protein